MYAPRYREEWLQKIEYAGVRRRTAPALPVLLSDSQHNNLAIAMPRAI